MVHGRKGHAFCQSHEDAAQQQRPKAEGRGDWGENGEERPENGTDGQDFFGAVFARENCTAEIHGEIAEEEGGQDEGLLGEGVGELLGERDYGYGHVDTVRVVDQDAEGTED